MRLFSTGIRQVPAIFRMYKYPMAVVFGAGNICGRSVDSPTTRGTCSWSRLESGTGIMHCVCYICALHAHLRTGSVVPRLRPDIRGSTVYHSHHNSSQTLGIFGTPKVRGVAFSSRHRKASLATHYCHYQNHVLIQVYLLLL